MEQNLIKSMVDLIDQTIAEIEELKKSDRFQASEIKIEGPGEGIAGKPVQGQLDAAKAEEEAKEEEERKKKEEEAKKAEMEKGINEEPPVKKEEAKKAEMEKGINEEPPVKKEEDEEDEEDEDEEEEEAKKAESKLGYELKRSEEEVNTLMKSMIDERVKPLEGKIDSILNLIKELADAPVAPKAVSYKDISPLKKSIDEEVPLSKSEVASKLLDLKKSGVNVDTMDITQAELGNPTTLHKIITKYNIK
jgi:flagellar biosynthesis GTPase FlhF